MKLSRWAWSFWMWAATKYLIVSFFSSKFPGPQQIKAGNVGQDLGDYDGLCFVDWQEAHNFNILDVSGKLSAQVEPLLNFGSYLPSPLRAVRHHVTGFHRLQPLYDCLINRLKKVPGSMIFCKTQLLFQRCGCEIFVCQDGGDLLFKHIVRHGALPEHDREHRHSPDSRLSWRGNELLWWPCFRSHSLASQTIQSSSVAAVCWNVVVRTTQGLWDAENSGKLVMERWWRVQVFTWCHVYPFLEPSGWLSWGQTSSLCNKSPV